MAQILEPSQVLSQTTTGVSAIFQILASKILTSPQPSSTQTLTSEPVSTATTSDCPSYIVPQARDTQQIHKAILAKHGIKVKDFAYESTLPPIMPVRLLPRQIQPGPGRIKRHWEDDNLFLQSTREEKGIFFKKPKLGREVTEPDIPPPSALPTRTRGFTNLDDYDPSLESQLITISSQQNDWSSQPPLQYDDESQESDIYIDTPIVTPNGSLQWRVANNSHVPASQLDSESQNTDLEPLSYSQIGFSQPEESSQLSLTRTLSRLSSGLSEPPPSPTPPQKIIPHSSLSSQGPHGPSPLRPSKSSQRSSNPSQGMAAHPTNAPHLPTPRYDLRKRVKIPPPSPAKLALRGRKKIHPSTHPASRPLAYSIQSSHSQVKSQSATSARSRTLRTRTAVSNEKVGHMVAR